MNDGANGNANGNADARKAVRTGGGRARRGPPDRRPRIILQGFAHASGMIKRIVTLSATAVCLAAAMLVLYNFTTLRRAEQAAHFAAVRAETETAACFAGADAAETAALRLKPNNDPPRGGNGVRLLCRDPYGEAARGMQRIEGRIPPRMPLCERRRMPPLARLIGRHGCFVLVFIPYAPCPPSPEQPAPEQPAPEQPAPEQPAPDTNSPEANAPQQADRPAVVDEAEEPAAE